jgi:DNA-binding transcriptional ArsR family regulator
MLARLSQGEASVNELAAPFKMSLPAVSKHIKVLEKAGLLTKTINAQQRPCKIDGVQLKQAVDWI